jgi:restriction endonuclease Mrr
MKGSQFIRYLDPVLQVLKDNGGVGAASEIIDGVIAHMKIPDAEVEVTIPSGQSRVRNQIQWARYYLAKAGLVDSPKSGVWRLTQEGTQTSLTTEQAKALVQKIVKEYQDSRKTSAGKTSVNIVFQCKRYKETVSPSLVRDFRGSMQGRAEKGLILTTGRFTQEAQKEANRDGVPPIELIDGERLVSLFEKYELGLKPKTVYELVPEFFRSFES